jgi:hypothetical protein
MKELELWEILTPAPAVDEVRIKLKATTTAFVELSRITSRLSFLYSSQNKCAGGNES